MSHSVILCEGYHDRAFWAGWLLYLGCSDPGIPPAGKSARIQVLDPWNKPVTGGQFAYRSKTGQFVRVVPCHGKTKLLAGMRDFLLQKVARPLARLVICVDPDTTST